MDRMGLLVMAAVMPLPWTMMPGLGRLTIGAGFAITSSGCPEAAMARFRTRVTQQTGVAIGSAGQGLAITCLAPAPDWPTLGEDESYRLDVTADGAQLTAPTATAALRGFETFDQLIEPTAGGFAIHAVHIEDHPRYRWRGLMMDVSRHWMPPEVIRRNLDAMAAVKLNVLHWHLSDDQGFRVESLLFPRLQQLGSDGNYYSQQDIRDIVAYARDRGIRVVPEFDMPGHTTSWFVGMPELAAAPGPYQIQRAFGVFPNVMAVSRESTYTFLDAFIGEMAGLFPDPYFHIGGDEVSDPDARALQPQFNLRVQAILQKRGKMMTGWQEILAPGIDTSAVVQAWRGTDALLTAARQGNRAVLSYGYYLDYLLPSATHYAMDPGDAPTTLGGEACMWAELVSPETVDSRIWPRMAAIAERYWSPRGVGDPAKMYARLWEVSRWLEWTGLTHRSGPQAMLARLGGGQTTGALRLLWDASEATGLQVRTQAQKYTSLTPLTRFVDAAVPESEAMYLLQQLAHRPSPSGVRTMRETFDAWVGIGDPGITELVPLSARLAAIGRIGLDALGYVESKTAASPDWAAAQNRALDGLAGPIAEVTLAAVRPVRELVKTAAAGPHTR